MFFPLKKINDNQTTLLARELEQLLLHYNFCPDFPKNHPYHKRYPFVRNLWDIRYVSVSFGTAHIELCENNLRTCPFTDYCSTCDQMERESRDGPQSDGFDLTIDDLLPKI